MANLTRRQAMLYTHTCDLWRPSDPVIGSPGERTWVLAVVDEPCYLTVKSSVDVTADIGLMESGDLMTTDEIRLQEGSPIDTDWIIVNKIRHLEGDLSDDAFEVWIVRGAPRRVTQTTPRREDGRTVCYLSRWPDNALPQNVQDAYGLT